FPLSSGALKKYYPRPAAGVSIADNRVGHRADADGKVPRAVPVHQGAKVRIDHKSPVLAILRQNDPRFPVNIRQRRAVGLCYPSLTPFTHAFTLPAFRAGPRPVKPRWQTHLTSPTLAFLPPLLGQIV